MLEGRLGVSEESSVVLLGQELSLLEKCVFLELRPSLKRVVS